MSTWLALMKFCQTCIGGNWSVIYDICDITHGGVWGLGDLGTIGSFTSQLAFSLTAGCSPDTECVINYQI